MIANMIKTMMKLQSSSERYLWSACRWFGKLPAAIRLQILVSQIKHRNQGLSQQYLDTYVKTVDGNFKRQLAAALSWIRLWKLWVYGIWIMVVTSRTWLWAGITASCMMTLQGEPGLGRVKTGLDQRKPSVVIWALISLSSTQLTVSRPVNGWMSTRPSWRPQLDDMAISRNIKMGNQKSCCSYGFNPTGKSSSRSCLSLRQ